MPTNIEIKARARDLGRQEQLAAALSGTAAEVLEQTDMFFKVRSGRLKLRELAPGHGQLIQYERENVAGPKTSRYSIVTTTEPTALRSVLASALGVLGEVRKRRKVYHAGQTRIHIDEVEGLGMFIELEVVLRTGQSAEEGQEIARELMRRLEIGDEDLVECAYIDLILKPS